MRAVSLLVVVVWALGAGYAGVAGWMACTTLEATSRSSTANGEDVSYQGISFQNQQEVSAFRRQEQDARLFQWIFEIPPDLTPFLTSIACGMLGGLAPLLRELARGRALRGISLIAGPLFSGVVGMMLFFILYIAPTALATGEKSPRSLALVAISFFGGAFSDPAFAWIEDWVRKKVFPAPKKGRATAG